MATAAFRSSTKRSTVGGAAAEDAGSSNRSGSHRRTRSLSRYSGRFPPPPPESDEFPTPRSRFVNKVRGSGFPEISLDDLADEFFRARDEEDIRSAVGRSGRRAADVSPRVETGLSRSRGRSVSRHHDPVAQEFKAGSDASSRRRRAVSAARYRCSDSENDMDLSHSSSTRTKLRSSGSGNFQQPSLRTTTSSRVLRRSMSQKDLFPSHDSYSSHSSLTDDEAREVRPNKNETEKTIRAVYAQEKTEHPTGDGEGTGFYEVMRKEVRHAVEEIRTEFEKAMVKTEPTSIVNGDGSQPKSSNVIQVISEIRRTCTTKLEQSEKRKRELLAELAVEEQRGQELTQIVRELLPEPKQTAAPERPSWSRRRSNDRTRMSKCLTDEAERYFEDFLSNVEDTDISSFDGERSDTSSTLGGSAKLKDSSILDTVAELHANLRKVASLPVESDGVVLPWLQWETSNDTSPSPCKTAVGVPIVSGKSLFSAAQEASSAYNKSDHLASSLGSWSPEGNGSSSSVSKGGITGIRPEVGFLRSSSSSVGGAKGSSFDMEEYLLIHRNQDLVFERLRQRKRIESGSLILCGRNLI